MSIMANILWIFFFFWKHNLEQLLENNLEILHNKIVEELDT